MDGLLKNQSDEITIKLLHYFIIEQGYNPIVLHGAKDEIWLENLNGDYNIIRISSNYIHNNEQLDFDLYKTKQIMKNIKRKTLLFRINALNFFINLGENVELQNNSNNIICIDLKNINDLSKNQIVVNTFPTIVNKTNFKEKGIELLMKITEEIGHKSEKTARQAEDIFKPKPPIITYIIIAINALLFIAMYILGNGSEDINTLLEFGASYAPMIKNGDYYRLITASFLHIGILHIAFNSYFLYVIGPEVESFYGKFKFILIYLFSAISGSLLSMIFTDAVSAGASGALFGLLGSLLYFGYYHRVYLGSIFNSQIIPIILVNLFLGIFIIPGIDNAAHIGGLIGGTLISMALGIKHKSNKFESSNGIILFTIFISFLIYLGFFA